MSANTNDVASHQTHVLMQNYERNKLFAKILVQQGHNLFLCIITVNILTISQSVQPNTGTKQHHGMQHYRTT